MAGRDPRIFSFIALGLCILFAILILAIKDLFFKRKLTPVISQAVPRPSRAFSFTGCLVKYYLFVAVVVGVYLATPKRAIQRPQPRPWWDILLAWIVGVVFLALPFLIVLAVAIWVWIKRDSLAFRAMKLAESGDLDTAIEVLSGAMEFGKPTATRANELGVLYLRKEAPELALKMFVEAAKIGGDRPLVHFNQAVALEKLGRLEEAAAILERVCRQAPYDWLFACNYARVLALLGHREEARAQLERSEALPLGPGVNSAVVAERERLLGDCRALLADKPEDDELSEFAGT